jgi:hypothetical protein
LGSVVDLHHRRLELRFCGRFVDQHDGDVVLYPIDEVTLGAFQAFWILAILEGLLAGGTNQDFEEILGKHDGSIVRDQGISQPRTLRNWASNVNLQAMVGFGRETVQRRDRCGAAFLIKAARHSARIAQVLRFATSACSG